MAIERLDSLGDNHWQQCAADHLSRYLFSIPYCTSKTVLDAGTGIGYGAALLAASGAADVTAVDIDEPSIQTAIAHFKCDNLRFATGDCETLEAARSPVDTICSFENIEHLRHPESFLSNAGKLLKPGGTLLCSTPDRAATAPYVNGKPANPYHVQEWHYDEFLSLLRKYYDYVEILSQVKAHWQIAREQSAQAAVDTMLTHSAILRKSPSRVTSMIGTRLGVFLTQPQVWAAAQVSGLATASPSDYPIVPRALASIYGKPWCHVAVCRVPRN